jgi:SRSO17 transposase
MTPLIETVPAMELPPQDIDNLLDELRAYHAIYSPLFQRREQCAWAAEYLHGLLLDMPRKSIEPMVLALQGPAPNAVRALQQFVSEGAWKDVPILQCHWHEVDRTLGEEDGVLTLDGSDFLKQGQESVGVKRQYCGEVGKRATCQAGVFLGYASAAGSTLLARRLYLPQEWVEDEAYADRRRKCGVPQDVVFKTKPQLGWDMIREVVDDQTLRGRWVTCDEAFGRDTDFLDQVARSGLWYFAAVPHDTRVWRHRPTTAVPAWSGRGRKPTRARLYAGEPQAAAVTTMAATMPTACWSRQVIKEGRKGPMVAALSAQRVVAVRDRMPGPEVWLVLRRNVATGEVKTSLCNAPPAIPLPMLVRLSGMRWPIGVSRQGHCIQSVEVRPRQQAHAS